MAINRELVSATSLTPDLPRERLLNSLSSAIRVVEDLEIRQVVRRLFHEGGFIFARSNVVGHREIEGLVNATDGNHVYKLSFLGETDPTVDLTMSDLQGKNVAYLTLSQPPAIRPELWNAWLDPHRVMSASDRQKLLQNFAQAKLDPEQTRKSAIQALWEVIKGTPYGRFPEVLGNLRAMGKRWGNFADGKNGVLHTVLPPGDVVYDYILPEERTNLLGEPDTDDLRRRVQKSFFQEHRALYRTATQLEGITGHQVISLRNVDFEMLPTKRGLEVFHKLKAAIPIMVSGLTENELAVIFEGIKDGELAAFVWNSVEMQLSGGLQDGFRQGLEYVAGVDEREIRDEIDREIAQRASEARGFRFLAQVIAQKVKAGITWRFVKGRSGVLQQLASREKLSVSEVSKKYGI